MCFTFVTAQCVNSRHLVSGEARKDSRVELQQARRPASSPQTMSRNFYILAATLGLFALIAAGMALVPSGFQPGLPANASLWRTVALLMLLAGLASALIGVMSHLFEQ